MEQNILIYNVELLRYTKGLNRAHYYQHRDTYGVNISYYYQLKDTKVLKRPPWRHKDLNRLLPTLRHLWRIQITLILKDTNA